MHENLWHDIILTLPATLAGLAALIASIRNRQSTKNDIKSTQQDIQDLHQTVVENLPSKE